MMFMIRAVRLLEIVFTETKNEIKPNLTYNFDKIT